MICKEIALRAFILAKKSMLIIDYTNQENVPGAVARFELVYSSWRDT